MVRTTSSSTTVPAHRAGPPGCGNGGWVSGMLVERLDDLAPAERGPTSATVRLTAPTPLDRPLRWEVDGTVEDPDALAVHLLHDDTLLGTARPAAAPEVEIPAPVALDEARAAAAGFDTSGHPFPGCYVCGPAATDGLHVYASPVPGRRGLLASPVTLTVEGLSPVLAALDCPGAFASGFDEGEPLLLGTFVVAVHEEAPLDRELVVTAWPTGRDGRKRWSGTALHDGDRLIASAAATWIAVPRDHLPGTAPAAG